VRDVLSRCRDGLEHRAGRGCARGVDPGDCAGVRDAPLKRVTPDMILDLVRGIGSTDSVFNVASAVGGAGAGTALLMALLRQIKQIVKPLREFVENGTDFVENLLHPSAVVLRP
jgi:hypothetical protein